MPLTLKKRGKVWYIRGTVAGSPRIFETTGTADRKQAEEARDKRQAELWTSHIHGEKAVITFAQAALSYVESKGDALSEHDRAYIKRLHEHFGEKKLIEIDQVAVDNAIKKILTKGQKPSTINRAVLTPLIAIMNHAARRKWCDRPYFERPALAKGRTRWLTPDEAIKLEDAAAPHLKPLIRFLICTGARLSEALELDWNDVDLAAGRVSFRNTKQGNAAGEERPRHALLTQGAIIALANLPHREGAVFLKAVPLPKLEGQIRYRMVPYVDRGRTEGGQIKTGFTAACRRAGIGEWIKKPGKKKPVFKTDVTPHVLRHTFATYFYALSKDPFLLRDEGGWATVKMVERYAHLMRSDQVAKIAEVWGGSHPRIGDQAPRIDTGAATA